MGRAEGVVARLLRQYERHWGPRSGDPFRSLVHIILSQNTSYINEMMAYEKFEREIGVTPRNIANATLEKIAQAIRSAGMHNHRSRVLKRLAGVIIERYDGEISPILKKDYPEAREELMSLPGVGRKTADVLLMFDAGKAVIPVDRHISRIAKRLELVRPKASYDEIRRTIEAASIPERCVDVHVLMIRFGREVCKAQNPRCDTCFLSDLCPYRQKLMDRKEEIPP